MADQVPIYFSAFRDYTDYCFLLKEDGKIIDVNNSFLEHNGYTKKEIIGSDFEQLLHQPSILRFEHSIIKSIENTKNQIINCRLLSKNGTDFEASLYIAPLEEKSRSQKYILIIAKDISEEKKKEINLLRFYNVAENTVNPLQITDLNGKMVYVNPAFVKASGYSKEELIGSDPKIFGSEKHSRKFWDNMWSTISSGKVWVGEVENRKKNGEPYHTQVLISPIINSEGLVTGYFGIHRDLTEKRNFEKQLIHTQKMESIGTLAAGVAHEVGNPLASISALVQIIQRSTKEVFIIEKMELIKKQITRISKIIRDLVDFSRPSNYELKMTDLNQIVKESIEIVSVGKKAKDIQFLSNLDPGLMPLALVSDQLQQVFVNILLNAVDAIIEKKANDSTFTKGIITVTTKQLEDKILITFEDNGPGVKLENRAKIFEPFFTTKQEGKGTGLGLWVSYGIVKSFQGDIKVESQFGKWTRFSIFLPINEN